jgi:O-antigen biosynthesis protein
LPGLDLSIIIVSFNTKDYLRKCLDSVSASNGIELCEVIVVDNCSVDGSPEMVESTFPRVKLIKPRSNLGFARANNMGAKNAHGRYLLFLNPDTVVSSDTFISMIEFMDQKPKAGAANCLLLNEDGSIQLLANRQMPSFLTLLLESLGINRRFPNNPINRKYTIASWDRSDSRKIEVISGAFFFIRSELFTRLGGFDERYFMYVEDFELSHRIQNSGYEIWFNPSTKILHYGGKSSSNHSMLATTKGLDAIYRYLATYNNIYVAYTYKSFTVITLFVKLSLLYIISVLVDSSNLYNNITKYYNIIKYISLGC